MNKILATNVNIKKKVTLVHIVPIQYILCLLNLIPRATRLLLYEAVHFFVHIYFLLLSIFLCFKAPGCKVHDVPPTFIKQGTNKIFMFPIKPPSRNPQIEKLMAKQCHVFECFEKRKEDNGKKVNTLGLNELIIDL